MLRCDIGLLFQIVQLFMLSVRSVLVREQQIAIYAQMVTLKIVDPVLVTTYVN